jgi:hypothetical protein
MKAAIHAIHLILALTGAAGGAHAQTPASYSFNSTFNAFKCTRQTGGALCSIAGSTAKTAVTVALANCGSDGAGGAECSGNWTTNLTVDNMSFVGSVTVVQDTDPAGASIYQFIVTVGNPDGSGAVSGYVSTKKTRLTDDFGVFGTETKSPSDANVSYAPVFSIGGP